MELGAFSVSLTVKDLQKSKAFYQALGFTEFAGDETQNWLIMSNGEHKIGLFQGMFEKNMLTFNPGWTQSCATLENFTDVRDIQKHLESSGITLASKADENSSGPAHIMLEDPDGNPILLDQHV
ncbi:putative Glyoxalase/Bleomycin resistance protein/Dihydroxybiphenyl dioxygenase [Vibrio nigripulchritudo MADA3029]|uniref:Putative Glyoxalase/Bleomycin resistance protein/Dihydroxybiphenyl dioxygenase n=1 Tax=Vibrio nigripulchritudo TaxID=28173 RepID=U4KIQ6_9VIBR|nr:MULTISPECIES: VOC family protein [Vibrio]EGU55098.1 glyoxalase/bleomycin resistance protein/dioxygenase [Vibrio nigripulchritudo ATCC 27043]KJY72123.1 glyoxalase [Vibrio nigripulchritudo]UAB72577.1 VOC family protein [Vibrio sp. SCSIO 43132]CCN49966.1 putative Glyoxalase/Bleomycin resistance protein/Dihydroxybiphenyl dioxygenase [Vibrio nigripulchritudo MADA3020]CCN56392.1 putative Glyoxalase/Bleomycin resistance protein/Dihydroxybiphenyl dioxygenase [Vibrio nigripulchritudo MADA3021]